jgi:hypothetical protein
MLIPLAVVFTACSFFPPHATNIGQHVWTNADLVMLHAQAGVSIIGQPPPTTVPEASAQIGAGPVRILGEPFGLREAWFRHEITGRIALLNDAKRQLTDFARAERSGAETSGVIPLFANSPGIGIPGSIQVLTSQIDELQTSIAALQEQARSARMPPDLWK